MALTNKDLLAISNIAKINLHRRALGSPVLKGVSI